MAENYQKVLRSPINTSISKNLYSFPKSERFERSVESPCRRSFYNIKKGALETRSTSFGYGNKISLINREGVPPPGSYDRNSDFLLNRTKNKGYAFGNDKRETFDHLVDAINPGPGKYDRVFNNYGKISFSFRSKYEDPLEKHKNQLGPGQYEAVQVFNATGKYFNSKYKSSGCSKIGNCSRFDDFRGATPGPGKYTDRLSINRTGNYFNSKIPSNYVSSFQGTSRPPINEKSEAPGPGTQYHQIKQKLCLFGILGSPQISIKMRFQDKMIELNKLNKSGVVDIKWCINDQLGCFEGWVTIFWQLIVGVLIEFGMVFEVE